MLKPLPTLRQLRYLTALARHRHFGKAAESCLATQSTVSAGLAELEATLNVTLMERSRRHVLMTPIGQQISDRAQQILAAAEELVDLAHHASTAPLSGPLSLGIIPTIAPYVLPTALPAIRSAFPDLKLHLREDLTANLLERLYKGELDAVLIALPYQTEGLTCTVLAQDSFMFVCLPDHPLAEKAMIDPADLKSTQGTAEHDPIKSEKTPHNWVLLEEGHCLRDHSLAACSLPPSSLGETIVATSLATLVQMVASGLGVTILPKLAIDRGILTGTPLVVRPLAPPSSSRELALCWRSSSVRAPDFHLLAQHFIPCLT